MLGDAVVDEAGPEGVTKLVRGDGDGFAGLVVETDVVLPANEAFPEGGVAECPVAVRSSAQRGTARRARQASGRGVAPAGA